VQSQLGRIQLGKFQLGALGVSTLTGTFSATASPTGSAVGSALALGAVASPTATARGSGGSPASHYYGSLGLAQLGRFWLGRGRADARDKAGPIVVCVGLSAPVATVDYDTRLVGTFAAIAAPVGTVEGHIGTVFFRGTAAPVANLTPSASFSAVASPEAEVILAVSHTCAGVSDPIGTVLFSGGQEEACISAPAIPPAAAPANAVH
jgi:hypothetical protein